MSTFNIEGPCSLYIQEGDGTVGTWVAGDQIGYTDNDDLIEVTTEDRIHDIFSVDQGSEVAEAVFLGRIITIRATLVKWVPELEFYLVPPGLTTGAGRTVANAAGLAGTIGAASTPGVAPDTNVAGGVFMLRIQREITAVGSTTPNYSFPACYLDDFRHFNLGNVEKRVGLQFTCTADSTGKIFYETFDTVP